ncbi:MAG TPA: DUF4340 domain-containing protein [Polyangiaceae bacterium]|jgi:hypothetical protein|nr:DUF4340 domain-containing protein [Polyangiaceae bacterium]
MRFSRALVVNGSIALLGLGSLVAITITSNFATTKDAEGREQNLLPVFRVEDVKSLELSENGQQIRLEREAATDGGAASFLLTRPVKELADANSADKFLNGLASAKVLRPVADGTSQGALGLDKPSAQIVIHGEKLDYELDLGGAAPAPSGARYVAVRSKGAPPKIFLIGKSTAEDLSFELDAFRRRSIVSVGQSDVTRIGIQSANLDLSLVRGKGKTFFVGGAHERRADRDAVTSLFFQFERMSAHRFLTSAEARTALGGNPAHFSLETKDPASSVRFDFGGSCPGDDSEAVVTRAAPSAESACTSRELDATLALSHDAFVDEHAFSLHADEVEELDIASDGKTEFRLVRKGTGFVLHAKTESDVALEAGNAKITDLLEARGTIVENPKLGELGLEPAKLTVALHSSAGREEDVSDEIVRVGNRTSAGDLYVYREADGVALQIPRDHARAFALDSTLLYARKLTEFGPSSFISAEIERRAGREVLSREDGGTLELTSPKGFGADAALSADVIQALGALEAERFVADQDDGSFGLSHASLRVHFAFKTEQNPKLEHTLRFGDQTALGVYATLDESGPVFVLPRSVEETLDTLLINRSPISLDSASFASFTLASAGRSFRFARHGDHFEQTPPGNFPSDKLPDLLEAISNLRPEAALHTGPPEAAEGLAKPILTLQITPKKAAPETMTFGAGDSFRDTSIFYLRISGVDATFVIAQNKVRPLLAAF